jgi:hypothetical protein
MLLNRGIAFLLSRSIVAPAVFFKQLKTIDLCINPDGGVAESPCSQGVTGPSRP